MSYVDLNTLHNPKTGTLAPASWGDQVRDNQEFLIARPTCYAHHSVAQTISNTTWTTVGANSEKWDLDGMHSTVTNSSRITIQEDGKYDVLAMAEFAIAFSSNFTRGVRFLLNGSAADLDLQLLHGPVTPLPPYVSGKRRLELVASDHLQTQVWQDSGGAMDVILREFSVVFKGR